MDSLAMNKGNGDLEGIAGEATPVASDSYGDSPDFEWHGRDVSLLKTAEGLYFRSVRRYRICRECEEDRLEPLTEEEAMQLYRTLPRRELPFEQAFPGEQLEND